MKILHINGTVKAEEFNGIKNSYVKLNEKNIKSFLLLSKKIDLINFIALEGYFFNFIQYFKIKFTRLIRFCINKIVNQYIHLYSNDSKKET